MADQEIIFTVEDAPEGGYTARALGYAISTQGEILEELRQMVRDAVNCHFEKENKPRLIRLQRGAAMPRPRIFLCRLLRTSEW